LVRRQKQFNKDALFYSKSNSIAGDSLYYDQTLGFGKAIKNVVLIDTSQHIEIRGNLAHIYEKEDYSFITHKPVFIQYSKTDTLYLTADTLFATYDSIYFNKKKQLQPTSISNAKNATSKNKKVKSTQSQDKKVDDKQAIQNKSFLDSLKQNHKLIKALHHVLFYRRDLQGVSDTMYYKQHDSIIQFVSKPILWSAENQLSATLIETKTFEGKLYALFLKDSAMVVAQNDTMRYNQIIGDNMIGYFVDNDLRRMKVLENALSIYWVKDENEKYIGTNLSLAKEMMIYINDNKIEKVSMLKKPEGTMHNPEKIENAKARTSRFFWDIKSRPLNREAIFQKTDVKK
jgi:hypothetical protein